VRKIKGKTSVNALDQIAPRRRQKRGRVRKIKGKTSVNALDQIAPRRRQKRGRVRKIKGKTSVNALASMTQIHRFKLFILSLVWMLLTPEVRSQSRLSKMRLMMGSK
jgi:hypothetical protein